MEFIWTIAILTIKGRERFYERLRSILDPQIVDKPIQVVVLKDNKERSIGDKRQLALELAQSKYISFIDDDDVISNNYCDIILNELKKGVDGVGFRGIMTSNSSRVMEFVHKAGLNYSEKPEKYQGSLVYIRPLNHLNPVKLEYARQIGFKDLNWAEDHDYCIRLAESNLIQDSAFIDQYLYFYQYRPNKKI